MVYEMRKQSMAWMEHRLQGSLKKFALSKEDKWHLKLLGILDYQCDGPFNEINIYLHESVYQIIISLFFWTSVHFA